MSQANAHEMWIEPLNFTVKLDKKVFADEKVGQNFKGNSYSYLASSYDRFDITEAGKTRPIKSRLGDKPALQETVSKDGLLILSAISSGSELVYDTQQKFETFIKSERLDWVFEEHKKRGLPAKGFKEIFIRYPKSLVKVGTGKGKDKRLDLPFEWVLETNPYTSDKAIKAKLYWQGKELANSPVNVFNRSKTDKKSKDMIKTELLTDAKGRIEIPRARGGLFLINSVKMIEPSKNTSLKTDAVWESHWASMTYEIINQIDQ